MASHDLANKISAAIDEWMAEKGGGMVTSHVVVLEGFNADGHRITVVSEPPAQTAAVSLGLLRWASIYNEAFVEAAIARAYRNLSNGDD